MTVVQTLATVFETILAVTAIALLVNEERISKWEKKFFSKKKSPKRIIPYDK